ncbi:hypothetical protein Dsin_012546 [Dipteronia sinensis]|uniref:Uncharacterized protein n=1 Tax=Dipteronia sinensis TaxID=43782 RepID=A0AAE0AIA5_9ROSI|nr:hypothetical protein Dsin_012546 [Dipteronia sinensis]
MIVCSLELRSQLVILPRQSKNGKVDVAMEIYQGMLIKVLKPVLITHNFNGLCKAGDMKEARKLVDEMYLYYYTESAM